jgi:7,8-dihydro-6-hydroxymethylpterin-pyrophosphokinase
MRSALIRGEAVSADPKLTLPHARMKSRRFVLEPLAQIAPNLVVPPEGATVAQLLGRLPEGGGIRRIPW